MKLYLSEKIFILILIFFIIYVSSWKFDTLNTKCGIYSLKYASEMLNVDDKNIINYLLDNSKNNCSFEDIINYADRIGLQSQLKKISIL